MPQINKEGNIICQDGTKLKVKYILKIFEKVHDCFCLFFAPISRSGFASSAIDEEKRQENHGQYDRYDVREEAIVTKFHRTPFGFGKIDSAVSCQLVVFSVRFPVQKVEICE